MQLNNLLRQSKTDAGFFRSAPCKNGQRWGRSRRPLYPDRYIPLVVAAGQTVLAVSVPQTVGQYICNRPAHLCVVTFDHDGFFREIWHNGDAALCGSRLYGAKAS